MRVRVTSTILSLLVIAIFASAAPTRAATATPPPATHVYLMSCTTAGVDVMFLMPSPTETQQELAVQGVSGTVNSVWIDLSLADNNFFPGSFVSLGAFGSQIEGHSVFWSGLLPGKQHFYRYNALVGERWIQIGSGYFETPDCDTVTRIACDGVEPFLNKVRFYLPVWRGRGAGPPPDKGNPVEWLDLTLWYDFLEGSSIVGTPIHAPTTIDMSVLPGIRHFYRGNVLAIDGQWYPEWHGTFLSLRCDRLPHAILPTDIG